MGCSCSATCYWASCKKSPGKVSGLHRWRSGQMNKPSRHHRTQPLGLSHMQGQKRLFSRPPSVYHHSCPCLSPHGLCGDGKFFVSSSARHQLSACSALAWGEEGWGYCRFLAAVCEPALTTLLLLHFSFVSRFCCLSVSVMTLHLRYVRSLRAVRFQDPGEPH